jgi:hypothetical protein
LESRVASASCLDVLEFGIGNRAQYQPAFILHSSVPSQYRNWLAFPLHRLSCRPLPRTEGPKNCAAPSSLQRAALSSDDAGEPHRPHSPSSRVALLSLCWRVDLRSSPLSIGESARALLPLPVSRRAVPPFPSLAGKLRRPSLPPSVGR